MRYNALTGKLKNAQTLVDTGIDNVQNLQFNSTEDRKFFNSVLTDLKDNTNITNVSYDESKNDFIFTDPNRPDQKITMKELFDKVGYKDIKIAANVNKVTNQIAGGKDLFKDKNDAINRVYSTTSDSLSSNQDIISAFTDKDFTGMGGLSVEDVLKNRGKSDLSKEIYTILQNIDLNNDGEVNDKDATLATPENYVKLVESINSDIQLKKEIIARTVGSISGGNAYDIMKRNTAKPTTPTPKDDKGGYFGYSFVPSAAGGKEIQVSPASAAKAYSALENKTIAWEGAQGYYAKIKDRDEYVRYDSRADYLDDVKNGKLAINEAAWKKIFGDDSVWNVERVIPADRVRELEGAFMIPRGGRRKYD